jgi:oligopeptide transport system substrate-binding protein
MVRKRGFGPVAVGAALALLLAACGSSTKSSDASTTPVTGGNLVDLQNFAGGDPEHIDPALASDVQSEQIADLLYEGLTTVDATGAVHNAVAQSVSSNTDATVWTFKLRNDVKFDNGDPVLPSSFKFAWTRALTPAISTPLSDDLSFIKGSSAVLSGNAKDLSGVVADDANYTLTVTLVSPYRDFPSLVSIPLYSPLPEKAVSAVKGNWEDTAMVGDGAFKMASPWKHGQDIKLLRSDTYYGGTANHKAYVDSVDFRMSQDVNSAFQAFQSGRGQVGRVPAGQYAAMSSSDGNNVVNTPLLGTEYWGFNMSDPTVGGADNQKLRQAIALAINKTDIVQKVYDNSRLPATGWAPPAMPGYQPPATVGKDPDVDQAKSLLTQWGKTPPHIQISFASGTGKDDEANIIQQNLAAVGISASVNPMDRASFGKAVHQGGLQFFWGDWVADYVSYDDFITPLFYSASIGDNNTFNYKNTQLDSLITTARAESDAGKQQTDYRQAEKMIMDDQVVVPIDWSTAGMIKSPQVHGLQVSPLGFVPYGNVWLH